ncbi:MAG: imidazole glycerol phosphate synthase subunit HisF [Dehalococcoidales bacterium]|nr:imidazole glycerol phosphate synthase subunit HisF [Dehalococcoidales bacterium]MDD3264776.1 imidazole glycerol phosphate synthase subunit HisF [Dehalococcoidales bacterium]MDD4322429.1 imidazole glycerol phosphate synthase subunit HisF [Dehalococcoidales bacterium]MDD5122571.1 imidazole glycerol phosphate synthase subunit HisF [Dehalococcoidales bacterium]MDD5498381.1 imidazole glycerol phosphate synthase subunit HisF [Dehalococcoidales bacterium]
MLSKRIIPCLDVQAGRVVKGTSFLGLREAGDPVELATRYYREGADELVFLDISATSEGRDTMVDVVEKVAEKVFMPLTVGGGIRNTGDIRSLLGAGADKVSLNSAAVKNPEIISQGAEKFGSQCIVVAIDARRRQGGEGWEVFINSGTQPTGLDVLEWALRATEMGAGEVLLTSMDADGHRSGYDIELTRAVSESVNVPVIASGGAGSPEDLFLALNDGKADAVLAASIFHYRQFSIADVKAYLFQKGVPVRL